jgi:hypothetical protein
MSETLILIEREPYLADGAIYWSRGGKCMALFFFLYCLCIAMKHGMTAEENAGRSGADKYM